jgi:ribosomal protein S8E
MKILRNLSELNNERIILKDSNDKIEQVGDTDKKNEKKKNTLIGNTSLNGQLSLIKEDSFEDNSGVNEEKKELEISIVGKEKLETKKKNVSEIQSLIQKCDEDIINLNQVIKKYQYATKDLIMKSEIIDNNSMIFINKKEEENEENDDMDKKAEYFKEVKNEFCILKRKLENLLSLYQLEKELTEKKKEELEHLERLNQKYNQIKLKQMEKII